MIHRLWKELDLLLPRLAQSTAPRSAGIHCSELYGRLHPPKQRKPGDEFTEFDMSMFALGGFAVERVLELGIAELLKDHCPDVERPGEIVSSEGVICSPDLFFYEPNGDIIIGDVKAKWMSVKNFPMEEGENEFPLAVAKNLTQLMAYLHVLSEQTGKFYNRGRLIIYFVNGAWKPMAPRLHGWDLEWSEQEISETWAALMTIKEEM